MTSQWNSFVIDMATFIFRLFQMYNSSLSPKISVKPSLLSIGSDNGLPSVRHRSITWTNYVDNWTLMKKTLEEFQSKYQML